MSIQFSVTHNKPLSNISTATCFGNQTQQSSQPPHHSSAIRNFLYQQDKHLPFSITRYTVNVSVLMTYDIRHHYTYPSVLLVQTF